MTMRDRAGTRLAGREAFLSRLLAQLTESSGCGAVLLGGPGIGKTALAEELVSSLPPAVAVVRVHGSEVLTAVPYGALSAHLRGLAADEVADAATVMRRLAQAIAHSAVSPEELPLLLIDDAHDLDAHSVALLAQLIAGHKARALILARPLPGLPQGFAELADDGLLSVMAVGPLTLDDVGQVCSAVLRGPVVSATVRSLAESTGGNAMLLRMVLREAVHSGLLQQRNAVWRLVDAPHSTRGHLADLVRAHLAALDRQELEGLEFVALAEPAPAELVHGRIGSGVTKNLLDKALVRTTADGTLVVGYPLYGEALRASIPPVRKILLRRAILAAMQSPAPALHDVLRHVRLALDAGTAPDDEALLAAARIANSLHDGRLALRAVQAIPDWELHGECLIEAARAEAADSRIEEARALVDSALSAGEDARVARDGLILSLMLRARVGSPAEQMYEDVERAATTGGSGQGERSVAPGALAPAVLAVARNVIPLISDGGTFDADAVRAIADAATSADQTVVAAALLMLATDLLGAGRPMEAVSRTRQAMESIAPGPGTLTLREFAEGLQIMALVTGGEWEQARSACYAFHRGEAGNVAYVTVWTDIVDGVQALREGRFRAASSSLLVAAEGVRTADHLQVLPWVAGLAAYAALLSGDVRKARALVDTKTVPESSGLRLARLLGAVYTATVTAVLAADADGPAKLVALAGQAERAGFQLVASTALDQALILGDTSVFTGLAHLTASFDGREQQLLHAFAAAGAASSPELLVAAGDAALAAGYRPLAAGGYQRARELYEKRRSPGPARAAQRKLATATTGIDGAANPQAINLPAAVRLTPRELVIVNLALDGLTNREIATRQGTSVRTVEGHLYRIFTKFGINRREELRLFMQED